MIGATGAVDHAMICDEAEQRFGRLSSQGIETKTVPARYQGGDTRLRRRLEQAHVTIGFEGTSFAHEDFYAMQIFANAAGGGMSSRLFQEVRETRGLAYSIHAFHWGYSDTGVFGFYAATSARDIGELLPVALDCLGQAALDLSDAEVRRAKAQMKVSLLAALKSPTARCEQIARQLIAFNRVLAAMKLLPPSTAWTLPKSGPQAHARSARHRPLLQSVRSPRRSPRSVSPRGCATLRERAALGLLSSLPSHPTGHSHPWRGDLYAASGDARPRSLG